VGYLFGCTSSRLRVDSRRTQDHQIENELIHEEGLLSTGRRAGATLARKIWDALSSKLSDVRPSGLSSTLRICSMLAFTDSRLWSCGRMGLMDRMGWAEADRWTLDCCCCAATCRATGVSRKFCWGPSRSKLLRIRWNGKVVGVARPWCVNVASPPSQIPQDLYYKCYGYNENVLIKDSQWKSHKICYWVGTTAQFGRASEISAAKRVRFRNKSEGVLCLKIVLKKG